MKAADLHNGIRAAVQAVRQPPTRCTRCRTAPVPRWQLSLPIRSFASSSIQRAEDGPDRITKFEAAVEDTNIGAPQTEDDASSFRAAPEIDIEDDASISDISSLKRPDAQASTTSPERPASLPRQQRERQRPSPRPQQQARQLRPRGGPPQNTNRLRVVPASPSYFTSRPNFTDHYLEISALYRKHQLLPPGSVQETKITWLPLQEYKALIGDENVAAGRYRQLIDMCAKLSKINKHLMPEEVMSAVARFMKEEQPRVSYTRQRTVDEHGRAYGLGRRKAATARAWIVQRKSGVPGEVMVNGRSLTQYFSRITHRESAIYALAVTERVGNYNVWGVVEGGGNTGQAEALTLAVAKALCVYEPDLMRRLKSAGCLTRDRRRVERKKPGHLKARKKPAWVKR